jgi:hypothetical protein
MQVGREEWPGLPPDLPIPGMRAVVEGRFNAIPAAMDQVQA